MKKILIATLILAVTVCFADKFDEQIASVQLLQSKPVQKELGITEAQRTKMNKFAEDFNAKANSYQAELAKKSEGGKKEVKRDGAREAKMLVDLKAKIISILSQYQIKRLRELSLQAVGVTALGDDIVANKVGIDATQKGKIRKLVQDGLEKADKIMGQAQQNAMKGIPQPKNNAEAEKAQKAYEAKIGAEQKRIQPSLDKIRADTIKNVLALLSAKQKASWNALLGKVFKG